MIVYDEYGKPILHQLYLAYPNKNYIGKLNSIRNYKPTLKFYSQGAHSIELDIYEKLNSNINPIYDQIEVKLLVEVVGIGWFTIISCDEQSEGLDNYKHISLESYETFLLGKQLDDINDVFGLYDVTDTEHSILHICAKYSGWNIGHIDNELLSQFRTFNVDSIDIYTFLMGEVSSSFKCIFKFDTYEETINAYLPEHLGDDTDIFISNRNILQRYNKSSTSDKIVTKLRVRGGTGSNGIQLDIRDINPDGSNELINLDYYLPMMSEGLRNAWIAYEAKYNNSLTNFNTLITSWKNKMEEKVVLDSELKTLEMNRDVQDEIVKSYIYTHPNIHPLINGYQDYLTALNSYSSYVTQVANKYAQIKTKETEISNIKVQLDDFQTHLTAGNFTPSQLSELEKFLTEGDIYEDSTFTITDTMSDKDKIDMQLELRNNASVELYTASKPQYEITIEASNLYSIADDISKKISYDKWKQQLIPGNFATVKLNDYSHITLRILEVSLDYTSMDKISITLSTKSKTDENEINVLLNSANKTNGIVSLNKYGYDQASKITSEVRTFMNSSLDATKNKVMSNPNAEFEVTPYGAMMKQWNDSQKKYSDYQSMWSGYNLLFSSDGFKTAKAGIGLFVDPSNNFTYYGVLADVIVGQLVVGERLKLSGSGAELDLSANDAITGLSSEFKVDINGLRSEFTDYKASVNGSLGTMQSSITQHAGLIASKVSSTDYNGNKIVSMINQSASKIEQKALNIDLTGYVTFNSLSTVGQTTINGGNIKTGTITGVTITGNTINGGSININNRFKVDSNGNMTVNNGTFSGNVSGSTIIGSSFLSSNTSTGNLSINGGMLTSSRESYTLNIESGFMTTSDNIYSVWITPATIECSVLDNNNDKTRITPYYVRTQDVETTYINGSKPITESNISLQNVAYAANSNNANYATNAGDASNCYYATNAGSLDNKVYVSSNDNLRRTSYISSSCGTSDAPWSSVWSYNGTIQTSDIREKEDVQQLDKRFVKFAKMIVPYSYRMVDGESGRRHIGFIAQYVEEAMKLCEISDVEFAGLVKAPIHEKICKDGEYDVSSPIIDYSYHLRYDEFIPLLFLLLK